MCYNNFFPLELGDLSHWLIRGPPCINICIFFPFPDLQGTETRDSTRNEKRSRSSNVRYRAVVQETYDCDKKRRPSPTSRWSLTEWTIETFFT